MLDLYGPQVLEPGTFAHNCLMARRLIERGVRFVQVMHAGWDQHNSLTTELYTQCKDTDQPAAGLIRDLKQRGLLDDTLVIWSGEFGRTPFIQGNFNDRKRWGRDHHPYAFTAWMAGGGVKPGITYGASDDLAMNVAESPVHVHDFQATWMHLLGIDHKRLTYRFQGRDFRLTDIHGTVVKGSLGLRTGCPSKFPSTSASLRAAGVGTVGDGTFPSIIIVGQISRFSEIAARLLGILR